MTEQNTKLSNIFEILKLPVENLIVAIRIARSIARWCTGGARLGPRRGADSAGIGVWVGEEDYVFLLASSH